MCMILTAHVSLAFAGCSQAFNDWCNTIDAEFVVKKITVQSVDMFGPRMGFVKFKGDITDEQGRVIPSIVFMRGACSSSSRARRTRGSSPCSQCSRVCPLANTL